MKTTLTVNIEYDPAKTDPEGLASAMDRLLETALSTPGIMDEYGNPRVGEFFVADQAGRPAATTRWMLFNRDTETFLTTRTFDSYEEAVEAADRVDDILVLPLTFEEE